MRVASTIDPADVGDNRLSNHSGVFGDSQSSKRTTPCETGGVMAGRSKETHRPCHPAGGGRERPSFSRRCEGRPRHSFWPLSLLAYRGNRAKNAAGPRVSLGDDVRVRLPGLRQADGPGQGPPGRSDLFAGLCRAGALAALRILRVAGSVEQRQPQRSPARTLHPGVIRTSARVGRLASGQGDAGAGPGAALGGLSSGSGAADSPA